MQSRLVYNQGQRTYVLVFETGDEVLETLRAFAHDQGLRASRFSGIGAFKDAVLGYYDWEIKGYRRIAVPHQAELLSLNGTVALDDGEPTVHAHAVLARPDGMAMGGHLLEAHVRPTLEMTLTEALVPLTRQPDAESGLKLIDLETSREERLSPSYDQSPSPSGPH